MSTYRVRGLRGPNMIVAHPQRLTSSDGSRWATGRNVKGEMPGRPGHYHGVEVWTLKHRVDGKAVESKRHATREEAERWVESGTSRRWRCTWKFVPPAHWPPDEPEVRGTEDVEAPDRDSAIIETRKAAHRSAGVTAAHVDVITIEELPAPKPMSDMELRMLAWGILDTQPKDSDAYKLAKGFLLRSGKVVP